jgi:hypothetical protein
VFTRLLIVASLMAHAAIHAAYITPRPPATAAGPEWPFDLGKSWILTPLGVEPGTARVLGLALVAATFGGFALAALATIGLLQTGLWTAGIAMGSGASLVLLGLFFHPWLVLGVAIDAVLLWAVLVETWAPERLAL